MSRKIETLFREEVRSRMFKKFRQKIAVLILGLMTIGFIYSLHQGMFLTLLILCLVGFLLITILVPKWYRNRFFTDNFFWRYFHQSPFKKWPRKYIFGLTLLGFVMIMQVHPSLIMTPLNQIITRTVYNPQPPRKESPWFWQSYPSIHSAIMTIPPEAETNIASVAAYIMQQEDDPWLRIKAINDYVISRVSYDQGVLENIGLPGSRPEQDARTVFRTHKAVCEGYARLFKALGKTMGMEVVYLTGDVRRDFAPTEIIPPYVRYLNSNYDWTRHAWNAVKIEDEWYLVDPTWNDGNNPNDYLLVPPEIMNLSHHPDIPLWQLLDQPINRSEFEDQPILSPQFFRENLELSFPRKYQTKVQDVARIELKVPLNYPEDLIAGFIPIKDQSFSFLDFSSLQKAEKPQMQFCQTGKVQGENAQITCQFPNSGNYQVFMFVNQTTIGQLKFAYRHS